MFQTLRSLRIQHSKFRCYAAIRLYAKNASPYYVGGGQNDPRHEADWFARCAVMAGLGLLAAVPVHPVTQCEQQPELKVLTYNVLAPLLARSSQFPTCSKEDLDANKRLPKILERLEAAVASDTVIGLQEIDLNWAGKLHAFFAERDYCVVFAQYGKEFNGYMGVLVAWPRSRFEAKDVEISRISDTAPKDMWPKNSLKAPYTYGTFSKHDINKIIGCYPPEPEIYFDEWQLARSRFNEAIFVRLQPRGSVGGSFVVSTYHMPCLFGSAPKVRVMNIHIMMLLSRLKSFANGDPAILMGDFNIKPQDSAYVLTSSGGDLAAPADWPEELKGIAEQMKDGLVFPEGLRSAYQIFHGAEPAFTNYAQNAMTGGSAFCETLDYIWLTNAFKVVSCPALPPSKEKTDGPFPSPCEPSDHLPMYATLQLA